MSQFQQPGPEQVPGAPQHPYQPEGRLPPKRPKRKIRWVAPVVTGIACLIIGIVIGGAGESGTTGSPVATATVTAKAKARIDRDGDSEAPASANRDRHRPRSDIEGDQRRVRR